MSMCAEECGRPYCRNLAEFRKHYCTECDEARHSNPIYGEVRLTTPWFKIVKVAFTEKREVFHPMQPVIPICYWGAQLSDYVLDFETTSLDPFNGWYMFNE